MCKQLFFNSNLSFMKCEMLIMASKKTKVVCGRVPHNIAKEMDSQGLKVPEAIQIALKTKRDPESLYKAELRSLLSEQEILASKLAHVNTQIDEYMSKLNINKSLDEVKEELFIDDNEKAIQTTLERFESFKGTSKITIEDFINSREGKRVIDFQLSKCDLTKEDFIALLIEKHEKSIQTTLDS